MHGDHGPFIVKR